MNRKILLIVIALAVVLLATPLVSAAPVYEKENNTKFETFHVNFVANVMTWLSGEHEFIPSMDNVNRLTINGPESFISYDITVDDKTYYQGVDFTYTGHYEYVFFDVTAWLVIPGIIPPYVWPSESRASQLIVDYEYDFLAASGIEGTIQMRAIANERGWMTINSLAGTGDLQNVQIKATGAGFEEAPLYYATHDGWVTGWPE